MKSPLIRCLVLVLIVLFFALLVVLSSPDRWRHSSDGSSLSSETSDRAWKWLQSKNSSAATGAISKRVPRIFCIVLTAPKNFHKLTAILSIWVSKCTNYRLISMFKANETIKSNSTRKFIGEPINLLQPPGLQRENYSELTDKVYNAVRDVYLEFGEQYDWYLKVDFRILFIRSKLRDLFEIEKADDDTYLNYENLLTFVEDKDPMAKYVYGSFSFIYYPYAVGGPGYLLGTKSFGMLGRALKNKEFCPNSGVEGERIDIFIDCDINSLTCRLGRGWLFAQAFDNARKQYGQRGSPHFL